jgi:hypothetical protein
MIEILEHFISQEARHPQKFRKALYRELLSSDVYLLTIGDPLFKGFNTLPQTSGEFLVWADQKGSEGFWVPVFPSSESVVTFISARKIKAPKGKEFLWMSQNSSRAFAPLLRLNGFSGLNLYLDEDGSVSVPQTEVELLAHGVVPDARVA